MLKLIAKWFHQNPKIFSASLQGAHEKFSQIELDIYVVYKYGDGTGILSAFRICMSKKTMATNKA